MNQNYQRDQHATPVNDNHWQASPEPCQTRSHADDGEAYDSDAEDGFDDAWDVDDDSLIQTISPDTTVSQTASRDVASSPLTARVPYSKAQSARDFPEDDFDALVNEDATDLELVAMSEDWGDYEASTQMRKSGSSRKPLPPPLTTNQSMLCKPVSSVLTHHYVTPVDRLNYPSVVRDRSLVPGLSSKTIVLVCFRTAAALAVGCPAARTPVRDVIIELFARVRSSYRTLKPASVDTSAASLKAVTVQHLQTFELLDLYDDAEPTLKATHEWWHGSGLGEEDTKPFLEARGSIAGPMLCRALGRVVRERKGWVLELMSIWQTEWEDVEWVRGIVCA